MNVSLKHILVIGLILLAGVEKDAKAQSNGAPPNVRVPTGIYAVVPVEDVVNARFTLGQEEGKIITVKAMNLYLTNVFYPELLDNAAVSGLALQVHWDTLNPNPPGEPNAYFWDYVDDAFSSVATWNTNHPNAAVPKTVQLIVSPGFDSPQWVLDELTSCDGLFYPPPVLTEPGSSCGKATFINFKEGGDGDVLPMPWNSTYQAAWGTFLQALALKYNDNVSFVSIAVAGPTAASVEILLPNGDEDNQTQFEGPCLQIGPQSCAISANSMWRRLLSNAGLPETEAAFVYTWESAIDLYSTIFKGLTLVVTTGNGLPILTPGDAPGEFPAPTTPINFTPDCAAKPNMDCQAETTILSFFAEYQVAESDGKATQTSGLEDPQQSPTLGIYGVKYLSQVPVFPLVTSLVLGGAQFEGAFSKTPKTEGDAPHKPDQALYNVLQVYFTGTSVAGLYCEPDIETGAYVPAPLNYLQIYYPDIQYASSSLPHPVTEGSCVSNPVTISVQDQLNLASQQIFEISEL
jgi:hypothetical protein